MDLSGGADGTPPTAYVPPRSLVVLAGLPGAGKSTVLDSLDAAEIVVLDSEQVRGPLRTALPQRLAYRWYRPVVHTAHRVRIGWYCLRRRCPVIAHEPATRVTTRLMLLLFARVTGRKPVMVWVDAAPAEALAGQYERGRTINPRSFRRHVRRAARVRRFLADRGCLRGWDTVSIYRRAELARGLRIRVRT